MPDLVAQPKQPGVGIEGGFQAVDLLARVVGCNQVLRAIFDPLDRPLEVARKPRDQVVLREEVTPNPEVAAGVGVAHVDAVDGDAEQGRERAAVIVGDKRRTPDGQRTTAGLPLSDKAAGLQGDAGVSADAQLR